MSFWDTIVSSIMTGASAGTAGRKGLVPIPAAGDQDKQLHGDGTWRASTSSLAATNAQAAAGTNTATFVTPANAEIAAAPIANPRAMAQCLVFDGSTGAAFNVPAFGTGEFTVLAWLRRDDATQRAFIGGLANAFTMGVRSGGALYCGLQGGASSPDSTGGIPSGQMVMVGYTRGAGVGTFSFNGVDDSSAADTRDYSVAITEFGSTGGAGSRWAGPLRLVIYNRALTAADRLARLEAGGPLAEDYNNASNTSLLTGDNSTFATAGNWTVTGGTTISGGKLNLVNGAQAYCIPGNINIPNNRRFRVTLTIDSITAGSVQIYTGSVGGWVTIGSAPGTYTADFLFLAGAPNTTINIQSTGGNAVVDTVLAYNLGAVFAAEANAPGNGYQWKDMSGNKADVTVPLTGVTWSCPSLGVNSFRGTLSWAGTNEAKALRVGGGQVLPDGAVVNAITLKATATSGATNVLIGTSNSATRWHAGSTFTTAKKLCTVANQLPASGAAADNDVLVDLDANYTGSVDIEIHYSRNAMAS